MEDVNVKEGMDSSYARRQKLETSDQNAVKLQVVIDRPHCQKGP